MKKTKDGKFLLHPAELAALIQASTETATKVLHDPMFDPNDDALPYYVNRGHNLLYGEPLFSTKDLDGFDMEMAEQGQKDLLSFESALSPDEVKSNFKGVDIGEGIIEALSDVLQGKDLVVKHRHL